MHKKILRPIHIYYMIALFTLSILIVGGVTYTWKTGPVNIENVSTVFEANMQIEALKTRNDISLMKNYVASDRAREAFKVLDRLERDVKQVHATYDVVEYDSVESAVSDTKKALNALIALPELSSVFNVLNTKVSSFENFVVSNNWRTLTRMSKRLSARLSPMKSKSNGAFSSEKLSDLYNFALEEVDGMEKVTTGSVLAREDKGLILNNLATFSTELDLFGRYVEEVKKFEDSLRNLTVSYSSWFKVVEPEVSFKRIEFEKNGQNLLLSLLGLGVLVFFMGLGGLFIYSYYSRKTSLAFEDFATEVIRDGLIPTTTDKLELEFSGKFREEFLKTREYMHKRMSFGSVFQDALPFSSLLLDSNLNVVWANSLFYEQWGMSASHKREENITWDFLQRFTNLGEDDPVLMAAKNNLAGIYQIQMSNKQGETLPFEMYVSPVEYAAQKRIMILFYPLRGLEETLGHQTKALVGPIVRTLDALSTNSFSTEFQHKVKKDFEVAGIPQVYDKFKKHSDLMTQQKIGLLAEIERLENEVYSFEAMKGDMVTNLEVTEEIQARIMDRFNATKKSIIEFVELRADLTELFDKTQQMTKEVLREEAMILSKSSEVADALQENRKGIEGLFKYRSDIKEVKGQIEDFRHKLTQSFEQLQFSPEKTDQILGKLKKEGAHFSQVLSHFGSLATSLDVGLSKMQIILDQRGAHDFAPAKAKIDGVKESFERTIFEVSKLKRMAEGHDDEMIRTLKSLVDAFKEEKHNFIAMLEVVRSQKEHLAEYSASHDSFRADEEQVETEEQAESV